MECVIDHMIDLCGIVDSLKHVSCPQNETTKRSKGDVYKDMANVDIMYPRIARMRIHTKTII